MTGDNMISLRDKESELLVEVGARLAGFGFSRKRRGQTFYKTTELGRLAFHLSLLEAEKDFDVTADVAVRFNAVEDLVNETNKLLSKAEKRNTFTLGCELGNLRDGHQRVWEDITPNTDVEPIADSIVCMFSEVGVPFLVKYSSMQAALSVLMADDKEASLHCPIPAERARRAVALASLLCGREETERLIADKRDRLRTLEPRGVEYFEEFARWLVSTRLASVIT